MGLKKKDRKSRRDRDVTERSHGNARLDTVLRIVATDKTFEKTSDGNWVGRCIHCLSTLSVGPTGETVATIEHIVPVRTGGSNDDLKNLALACATCNNEKGVRHDPNYPRDPRAVEVIGSLLRRRKIRWRSAP